MDRLPFTDLPPVSSLVAKSKSPTGMASSSLAGLNVEGGLPKKSKPDDEGDQDSFYKMYNKEIKVNQDQIPIVLAELADAAYNFIQRENFDKALILLQKAEGVLEVVNLEGSVRDRSVLFVTNNNMALCFQRLGMLDECNRYLKTTIAMFADERFLMPDRKGSIAMLTQRTRKTKFECKLRLQQCAILSQTQNHVEALARAKESVRLVHHQFWDLLDLCKLYVDKVNYRENFQAAHEQSDLEEDEREQIIQMVLNSTPAREIPSDFLNQSTSLLERSALKLCPVVVEVCRRMAGNEQKHIEVPLPIEDDEEEQAADMRSILGFLNQNEWIQSLNIGNIMQISPVSLADDFLSQLRDETELQRDRFLEKLSILIVSYFCMSTEMRFLLHSRRKYLKPEVREERETESEYWHAKALEVACSFLPSECPLLKHVLLSYQKHHDPTSQAIKEDQETDDTLIVLRSIVGVDNNKYQPIIKRVNCPPQVQISPRKAIPMRELLQEQYTTTKDPLKAQAPGAVLLEKEDRGNQYSVQQAEKSVNESLDLERQVLNMSPEMGSKQEPMSFDMVGLESQSNADQAEKSYENIISSIIDNPRIDKRQLLQLFVNKMQMSGQLSDINKELERLQRKLAGQGDFIEPYQSDDKHMSILEDGESLFKDPKSSAGVGEGALDDDYADLIKQIADGGRKQTQSAVIVEKLQSESDEKLRDSSENQRTVSAISRPSTALTAATKRTASQPRIKKKRNLASDQTQSQLIPQKRDRSTSSARSCKCPTKHRKSQRERVNQSQLETKQSSLMKGKENLTKHNFSTSSELQQKEKSKLKLKKVLPNQIVRRKQPVKKRNKSRSSERNWNESNPRNASRSRSIKNKRQSILASAGAIGGVHSVENSQPEMDITQLDKQEPDDQTKEPNKPTIAEEIASPDVSIGVKINNISQLQNQVIKNQEILLGRKKEKKEPKSRSRSRESKPPSNAQLRRMHKPKSQSQLEPSISVAKMRFQSRGQTMHCSNSGSNFANPKQIVGHRTVAHPIKSLQREPPRPNQRLCEREYSPELLKQKLIHEVNHFKSRMNQHFRHISQLSPKNHSERHESPSRSRSRSKSRSPRLPKRALLPKEKKKSDRQFNSASMLPKALLQIAQKINQRKGHTNSTSFGGAEKSRATAKGVSSNAHSLSMFDHEIRAHHATVNASTHQMSQQNPVLAQAPVNQSKVIPTNKKILPNKKVLKASKLFDSVAQTQPAPSENKQISQGHA